MIDPSKTTPEKLAEMNDSLIVDNNHLRAALLSALSHVGIIQFEQQHQRANGYWRCKHAGRWQYRHRVVWELHHGEIPDGFMVDHINAVRGDDRIENLQLVTNEENTRLGSYELKPVNTTGINCVNMNQCGRWYGQFRFNGKRIYCGTHATREQADAAVVARRAELNAPTRRVA